MSEKIIRIEETIFKRNKDDWNQFDGFQIITDKQTIKLGISNSQECCEKWGYFMTNDDLEEFEGAILQDISITNTSLNNKKLEERELYEPDLMFVNLKTNIGILQFTAYNEHSGYYGHDAIVISEQLNHEDIL